MRSREAVVMLLAIGLQESLSDGQARGGVRQFEKMGGVAGVLQRTTALAAEICRARGVAVLAMCMRRLSMMIWALRCDCRLWLIQNHCLSE